MKNIPNAIAINMRIKTMMSNMDFLQSVVYWANLISLGAILLSFIGGATSIVFNRWLNIAKDEKSRIEKNETDLKIAETNQKAAEANQKAAEANQISESERLARLKLESKLADRKLTKEQQEKLVSLLTPFHNIEADVVIFGDTPEIKSISLTIRKCLQDAGWKINAAIPLGGGAIVTGIKIGVRPGSDLYTLHAAQNFVEGLQSMGIDSGFWDFNKMEYPGAFMGDLKKNTPIKIFIGSKP